MPLLPPNQLLSALAAGSQSGQPHQIAEQWAHTLGRRWPWLPPLARRYAAHFGSDTRPRQRDVIRFFKQDTGLARAWAKHANHIRIETWITAPATMQPVRAARNWPVPAITCLAELANWLNVDPPDLQWFADVRALNSHGDRKLDHYHYRFLSKHNGNYRLIEMPKQRLKSLQRKILSGILDQIPPHPAVHGFTRGRSIKTFVQPHVGKAIVLRVDLQDFFPSFRSARIQAFFRTTGYPASVADCLAGICVNAAPRELQALATPVLYRRAHLPQGAPTSPALANLCTYRMDCRLAAYAHASGFAYSRYADDLAFSGSRGSTRQAERFLAHVAALVAEEGFAVQYRKTRIMRQDTHQSLAGLVVNQTVNISRTEYDRIKAILTNCIRHGPASQNRESCPDFRAHLTGRVAFISSIHPAKGGRLRGLLDRIRWS